jgi:vitamin B12 transporter
MKSLRLVAALAFSSSAAFAQSPSADPVPSQPDSSDSAPSQRAVAPGDAEASQPPPAPSYSTVVTATRDETSAKSVSSTVTVLTAETLRDWQVVSLADALRSVPGLDVARTGGLGAMTSVYTRGVNTNHTLVLVDGIEIADPSQVGGGAVDLADLTVDGVERIEILRGPASSLYGSDALGGVVNVITRRGRGEPSFGLSAEGGSFGTFRIAASASGSLGRTSFSGQVGHQSSDGTPLVANSTRPYGYQGTRAEVRLGQRLSQALEARLVAHFSQSNLQTADYEYGVGLVDDPNSTRKTQELLLRPEVRLSLLGGHWRQTLGAFYSHHGRNYDNPPNDGSSSDEVSRYQGRKARIDWQHELALIEHNQAMLLLESEWDYSKTYAVGPGSPAAGLEWTGIRNVSVALQDRHELFGRLNLTGSARLDKHSMFGSVGTYTVGAVAVLPGADTILRVNHGTAFKAPSLFQLKDPKHSNPDLKPERSRSFEAGFEQPVKVAGLSVGATFFFNAIQELIDYDSNLKRYINLGTARIAGIESFAEGAWNLRSIGALRTRVDYTWTNPKDAEGKDLTRRARNKAGLSATWAPLERGSLTARVVGVGDRTDNPEGRRVTLKRYTLVSLMARYDLTRSLGFFARVENLLDAQYQEAFGYRTSGRSAFAGVRVDL